VAGFANLGDDLDGNPGRLVPMFLETFGESMETKRTFEPMTIMGTFWMVFGVIVLLATFFVESTPRVPALRGIVTNLVAGGLLFIAGVIAFVRGRGQKRRELGE
jgi:hypothetical protein